jgi:hypothetical protein
MSNVNATVKRIRFKKIQPPIIPETISVYKKLGYKIADGIETVMIEEPDTTFRIFISRISHCLQFYFLGEPESVREFSTKYLESAAQVVEEEIKYKQEFG